MERSKSFCLFALVILAMTSVLDGQSLGGPAHGKVVVCYMASWAVHRKPPATFTLDDLNPALCTHLIYAFAGISENTHGIISLDPWQDLENGHGKASYKRAVALKRNYPHLKVTISIGGWNEGSLKFSNMAATPETREKFVKSVLAFLETHKFDGLDIDWEYPTTRDGKPEDKANFVTLVKELKEALAPHNYLLTAAFAAGKHNIQAAYNLAELSPYLDYIHLLCYDYHGAWDGVVGANAPLRGTHKDDVLSLEYTVKYMLYHGVNPKKMVLGVPTYGRSFILKDPETNVIEYGVTPTKPDGFEGPFTNDPGFVGYNEICLLTADKTSKWTHYWNEKTLTPYIRDGEKVITYDNARSIANKVKLAVDYGLAGVMVRYIDTDDFKGECRGEHDAYLDFQRRYNLDLLADDNPVLTEALEILQLPNGHSAIAHYTVLDGKLQLRLPERLYSNYNLMRTINDATTLALEEKRITDELAVALNKLKILTNKNSIECSNQN